MKFIAFDVILLELVTKRKPVESPGARWRYSVNAYENCWRVDPLQLDFMEVCGVLQKLNFMQLGLIYSSEVSSRAGMAETARVLELVTVRHGLGDSE